MSWGIPDFLLGNMKMSTCFDWVKIGLIKFPAQYIIQYCSFWPFLFCRSEKKYMPVLFCRQPGAGTPFILQYLCTFHNE